jgi:hypothetical protein
MVFNLHVTPNMRKGIYKNKTKTQNLVGVFHVIIANYNKK